MGMQKINFKSPVFWFATWFGLGLMKPAPGTWGSLGALPFAIIIYELGGYVLFIASIVLLCVMGVYVADKFSKATGIEDNAMIVIDEVAGQWIALLPVFFLFGNQPIWVIIAFILFRLFDGYKPWPVGWIDQEVTGGLGIMLDDIVAGIISALIITGIYYAGFG